MKSQVLAFALLAAPAAGRAAAPPSAFLQRLKPAVALAAAEKDEVLRRRVVEGPVLLARMAPRAARAQAHFKKASALRASKAEARRREALDEYLAGLDLCPWCWDDYLQAGFLADDLKEKDAAIVLYRAYLAGGADPAMRDAVSRLLPALDPLFGLDQLLAKLDKENAELGRLLDQWEDRLMGPGKAPPLDPDRLVGDWTAACLDFPGYSNRARIAKEKGVLVMRYEVGNSWYVLARSTPSFRHWIQEEGPGWGVTAYLVADISKDGKRLSMAIPKLSKEDSRHYAYGGMARWTLTRARR